MDTDPEHSPLQELRAIINNPNIAIISVNFSGDIRYWNSGASHIFGYSAGEMIDTSWLRLAPPEIHSELRKTLDKIRRGRTVPPMESLRLKKDGSPIHVEFFIYPIFSEDSNELIGATTYTTNISSRKKAEADLAESVAMIQTVVETVLDGILTIDEQGIIETLNPAIQTLFQYHAHELIGNNVNILMPEPYHSNHDQYLKNYLSTGDAKIIGIGREVIGKRRDGSTFPMYLAVNTMTIGNRRAFVGVVKDITELRQRELELHAQIQKTNATNSELQATLNTLRKTQDQLVQAEKMASLGNLVAGIAHEINTPVGISVTASSLISSHTATLQHSLEKGTLTASELNRLITAIAEGADLTSRNLDRAAKLINSFKQVAVDQTTNDCRTINLADYLHEVITSFQPHLKKHHADVTIDCPPDIVITTYAGSLYQVISNLIMNAILHGYDDGVGGKVTVSAQANHEGVELRVSDTGKGIPSMNLSKIYEPFFSTRRNRGGTGLGLHLTFNLVTKSLSGTIDVESEENQGTTFTIRIPRSSPLSEDKQDTENH